MSNHASRTSYITSPIHVMCWSSSENYFANWFCSVCKVFLLHGVVMYCLSVCNAVTLRACTWKVRFWCAGTCLEFRFVCEGHWMEVIVKVTVAKEACLCVVFVGDLPSIKRQPCLCCFQKPLCYCCCLESGRHFIFTFHVLYPLQSLL